MSRKQQNNVLTMTQYAALLSGRDYCVLILRLAMCARDQPVAFAPVKQETTHVQQPAEQPDA